MKSLIISILILLGTQVIAQNIEPIPSSKPGKWQKEQIKRKYGMFMHFGINTFVDKEWTDGSIPAKTYA